MEGNGKKKWTLMFFFASDNALSPSMLYQLKSIKTAGFQRQTNVLVHFDPHERGMPSMIFEINKTEKAGQKRSRIGDETDPIIRDLAGDQIEPPITEEELGYTTARRRPRDTDSLPADRALIHFLEVCRERYPADHYMLFLVGHGLVVGRDAFLPDDNPNSGVSLVTLGKILRNFSKEIGKQGSELELIGMHSCSMSAVEVVYQLKGTANYMLASEGLSFVGAWPYRQMLQKIFCAVEKANGTKVKVSQLMKSLHDACLHNSADFIFAGYSSDLCLCSLNPERVEALTAPMQDLTAALHAGLDDDRGKELIMLAHWKSQSYFQEVYTDLYDFCLCLSESCSQSNKVQNAMKVACEAVIKSLTAGNSCDPQGPIMRADFFGPDCQYSYGLSIYFPWAKPIEDASEHVIRNYESYAFVSELCGASWLEFLHAYFEKTIRPARAIRAVSEPVFSEQAALRIANSSYMPVAYPNVSTEYISTALTGKVSASDASGSWNSSVIKNYSREFSITKRALQVFTPEPRPKRIGRKSKT